MGGTMPVSGTVTATLGGTTQAGATAKTSDYDTGAGTDTVAMQGIALPASGGAVQGGTSTNPVRTDPTGTTTQPVSGTVTANAGTGTFAVSGTVTANAGTGTLAVSNAGTFAVQDSQVVVDNAGFTDGTSKVFPVAYIFDEVAGTALTENDAAAARIDSKRAQINVLEDATTRGQRATISAAGALKVDNSAVTQPVSGTVTANAGTGPFPVSDNSGSLTVDAPLATPVFSTVTPSTTGGWSKITALAQTTTKKAVKASAGTFGGYYAYNPNASVAYIQVFDVASASVTLGTTAPDLVFGIPPSSAANLEITNGVNMTTAITLACTTTATGSTAPATGLDLTLLFK